MAAGLAAELQESVDVVAELVPGSGGVFVVRVDGKVVFDKKSVGRFPVLGEVSGTIQEGMAAH